MNRTLSILLVIACTHALLSCSNETDPQRIVDRVIEVHGGDHEDRAVIEFNFRGDRFKLLRDGGVFQYERLRDDSLGTIRDVLNNEGIFRLVDGEFVELAPQVRRSIETDVNSVAYFVRLPFPLNDPAVRKAYLGAETIRGEPYHVVEVTFEAEGGGRDHEDRFVYWFHRERYTMDYLAYDYHTGAGGSRFREAVNVRHVGGIRIADYGNFAADEVNHPGAPIERYGELMDRGELRRVSDVEIRDVVVRPLLEQDVEDLSLIIQAGKEYISG